MNGPMRQRLNKTVKPNEFVDISVDLKSPNYAGEFQGNWMLSDANFKRFGTGEQADGVIWVRIRVVIQTPEPSDDYSFATNVCSATWTSTAGSLPCSGTPNNPRGWVIVPDKSSTSRAVTKTSQRCGPTRPWTSGGIITGTYTSVTGRVRRPLRCRYRLPV